MSDETGNDTFTVGQLRAYLEKHDVSDDVEVLVEIESREGPDQFDSVPCPGARLEIATNGYTTLTFLQPAW